MGAATCATVLQPLPISHHFHGCAALLALRFVVVKWRYIKYLALAFTTKAYRVQTLSERMMRGRQWRNYKFWASWQEFAVGLPFPSHVPFSPSLSFRPSLS